MTPSPPLFVGRSVDWSVIISKAESYTYMLQSVQLIKNKIDNNVQVASVKAELSGELEEKKSQIKILQQTLQVKTVLLQPLEVQTVLLFMFICSSVFWLVSGLPFE